jgi:hypothetical protein
MQLIKKEKTTSRMGENICRPYMLISKIYKEVIQLNRLSAKNDSIKNWVKALNFFSEEKCKWPIGIWKNAQYH